MNTIKSIPCSTCAGRGEVYNDEKKLEACKRCSGEGVVREGEEFEAANILSNLADDYNLEDVIIPLIKHNWKAHEQILDCYSFEDLTDYLIRNS